MPFTVSEALSQFASANNIGVETQTRIVDKNTAVDLADINIDGSSAEDHLDGCFEIVWYLQVFRKMIEGAERQHAKRFSAFRRGAGNDADRPVATAGDDDLTVTLSRLFGQREKFRAAMSLVNARARAV